MEPIKEHDPKQLGDWRIMGRLGEGGFGTVFLAERGAQKAAIKIVKEHRDSLEEGSDRFQLEINALMKLADPYISKIIDSDLTGEIPWFATEFVNGPTLEAKVKYEGALEERAWFNLASNLFHALSTSHAEGVVHKDIKPSNIILGESGNKLIDFGIAHISGQTRKVNFGDFEGSRLYSSPESSTGSSVPGMDVFSAAVTLAYAGLGKSIWKGENEIQLMRSINESEPDLEGLTQLEQTFLKPLLNKNASDRPSANDAYQTSLQILSALAGNTETVSLRRWERAVRATNQNRFKKLGSIGALTFVLIVGAASYQLLASKETPSRTPPQVVTLPTIEPKPTLVSSPVGDSSPTSKEIQANLDLAKEYFEKKDFKKSLIYAKLAADAGNAHGMYDIAVILVEQGKKQDAIPWYEKAANLGYGDAFGNLGDLYSSLGKVSLALSWYEKGGERKDIRSLNALGFYYGEKINNYSKAIPYYKKSAELGDVLGMANLGFAYERINDKINARKWLLKASDLGSVDASTNLGYLYERDADWTNAQKYYQRAADKKDPTAMYDLAIVLGNHFGQGDNGCVLLREAVTIKSIEPNIKKLADEAILSGCQSTTVASQSSTPKPIPSASGSFTQSPDEADNVVTKNIFGRSFEDSTGLDWLVPLTNSNTEAVPPITNLQFRLLGYSNKIWLEVGYKLKKGDYGVYAQVDKLMFEMLFKKTVCPEFRFVRIESKKVINIWIPGTPECATDYIP